MKRKNCFVCSSKTNLHIQCIIDDRYGSIGKYKIYKCKNCGFARLSKIIPKNVIAKFYAKYYPIHFIKTIRRKHNSIILTRLKHWLDGTNNQTYFYIDKKKKVLDVGCGDCKSLLEIKNLGGIPYGLDPNPYSRKIAQNIGLTVKKGFIYDNLFGDDKFDFVTASQVIEHDPNPFIFLKYAKNYLNVNGKIILSFPNIDSFYSRLFGSKWINWHVPYHINFFNRKSFRILAEKAGLKIIKMQTITPNIWTVLQIRSLFYIPKEGVKNPMWNASTKKQRKNSENNNDKKKLLKYLQTIFLIFITPFNRITDLLGLGDSLLVILEAESNI